VVQAARHLVDAGASGFEAQNSCVVWEELCRIADQTRRFAAFSVLSKKHTFIRDDIFNDRRSAYRTFSHELRTHFVQLASEDTAEKLASELETRRK